MIEIKNVCVGYQDTEVLHDVSLSFEPGKVTVLLGPNGSGKSTLLKSVIRLISHTSGEILLDGQQIEELNAVSIAKKVSYIPQSRKTPDISVLRMVLHGRFAYLKYPRRYRPEDFEMGRKALQWVGIEDLAEKNVAKLSGGTQQKVYIAMALAQDTPTILMDEPTVYLDISHQLRMMKMARKLADQGKAVVMVLHDLAQAFQTADRVAVMSDGRIVACGEPEEVFQSGIINEVFGVTFERIYAKNGWKYFCE